MDFDTYGVSNRSESHYLTSGQFQDESLDKRVIGAKAKLPPHDPEPVLQNPHLMAAVFHKSILPESFLSLNPQLLA